MELPLASAHEKYLIAKNFRQSQSHFLAQAIATPQAVLAWQCGLRIFSAEFLATNGTFEICTDLHGAIYASGELRMLEWGERLKNKTCNV